ncbi:MAG: glycosyltransferase, partial [Bacteroidota bacterium]
NQPVPIEVIPCCADTQLFDPTQVSSVLRDRYIKQLKLTENYFILTYLGSVGTWYMLPEMLDFFKKLLITQPNAIFLFITAELPQSIIDTAQEKGVSIDSLRIIAAAREEVPTLLSLTNVGIFFIKPVFSKKASSPTKQGEMMSMGIPVICNSGVGDTDFVIENYKAGILVEAFNDTVYQEVIDKLTVKPWADPKTIRKHAEAFYSLEKGAETYASIYDHLIGLPKKTIPQIYKSPVY